MYCTNCKIRAVYRNGLCYECTQQLEKRKSSPHGTVPYNKYNPEMSKTLAISFPEPIVQEKRRKRNKRISQVIKGELLTNTICKGYELIYWKEIKDKPEIDENNLEYYYIEVKPYSKNKKIQVMVDHRKKIIYFSAVSLTKCYTNAARQRIIKILAEIE